MERMHKEEYRFYFRADGNDKIGAGHLMRCLTIAEALSERLEKRERICFLTADEQSAALVREKGFPAETLGTDCFRMEEEFPALERIFGGDGAAVRRILTDSYFATDRYLSAMRQFGEVWLLEDKGEHAYPVDAVINYNLYASEQKYRKLYEGTGTRRYLGSPYVPVRKQFLDGIYEVRERVENVLITTGGGDSGDIASQILKAVWRDGIHYHVVLGRFNPHIQEWRKKESSCSRLHVHVDVSDMAGLMRKCDIAITAGGSTVYELSASGVPFLCFSYAENQESLAAYIGEKNAAGYGGMYHREPDLTIRNLGMEFDLLEKDYAKRKLYSNAEKRLIDGRGAYRIAELFAGM